MFKRIRETVESFIPQSHRNDPELLRRGRIFVWIYSSGIPLISLLNVVEIISGKWDHPLIGIGFITFFIVMLILFKKGVSAALLNNIIMFITYAAFIQGVFAMGGLRGANMPFIILFPQVSMLLSNRASGIAWLMVSAVIILAIYLIGNSEYSYWIQPPDLNDNTRIFGYLINALFFIFGMLWISESSRIKNLKLLHDEQQRSDNLLLNILPSEVAQELKDKGSAEARHFEQVSVLFTDFKGFTSIAEQLSAQELVKQINECFSAFDQICGKYGIEKIKTIGDSYMAAGGLPVANTTHAEDVLKAALEIREFIGRREAAIPLSFQIRIGIHTGPVVAGIVGIKKFQYDIWGDTVNMASRMESSGEEGKVNISESTYQLVKDKFNCGFRGEIEAKGKGKVKMYFAEALEK